MALLWAKAYFKNNDLTASIGHEAGYNLIETIEIFKEYFEGEFPKWSLSRVELFLSESDLHAGKKWQVTNFGS